MATFLQFLSTSETSEYYVMDDIIIKLPTWNAVSWIEKFWCFNVNVFKARSHLKVQSFQLRITWKCYVMSFNRPYVSFSLWNRCLLQRSCLWILHFLWLLDSCFLNFCKVISHYVIDFKWLTNHERHIFLCNIIELENKSNYHQYKYAISFTGFGITS